MDRSPDAPCAAPHTASEIRVTLLGALGMEEPSWLLSTIPVRLQEVRAIGGRVFVPPSPWAGISFLQDLSTVQEQPAENVVIA